MCRLTLRRCWWQFSSVPPGLLDVVVNINGIFIERKVRKRLMSGMQAMWSLGNFAGAAFFALLLQFRLPGKALPWPVPS